VNAVVENDAYVDDGTPGTRLTTTNSSSTYCGEGAGVTIYYQRDTSQIMRYTFTDDYATGGMAGTLYYGSSIYSSQTVETYGLPVTTTSTYTSPISTGRKHYTGWQIFGILVAVVIIIVLLCACCGLCFS
jgi:hypothetical protein